MKPKPNKVRRTFRINHGLNAALVKVASKLGVTQTWLVENALRDRILVK